MMISNGELQKFISGAVFFEEADGIIPYRFTKEEMRSCENEDLRCIRQRTGLGIKINFTSDMEEILFSYKLPSNLNLDTKKHHTLKDMMPKNMFAFCNTSTEGTLYLFLKM